MSRTLPQHLQTLAALLGCGLATTVRAQSPAEDTIPTPLLMKKVEPRKYSVSLSYGMGLNITAQFKNLGSFPPSGGGPGPALPGMNHNYDDGYNRVDITGNNHGGFEGTWNWGYNSASQISGDTLTMQSSSLAAGVSSGKDQNDPQPGFELTVGREFGGGRHWNWGGEGSFGFTSVTLKDNQTLLGNATVTSDAYALNGVIPPVAPYQGNFAGPGPIIGDAPSRTVDVQAGAASIAGSREIDADLFGLKLGPYFEVPLGSRLAVRLRGGLALVEVNSEFTYTETTTLPGLPPSTSTGHGWHSGLQVGGYAGATLSCSLNSSTRLLAGGEFVDVGKFTQNLNGRQAVLDLSRSVLVTFGLSYSF
jgi:hypothetical protein